MKAKQKYHSQLFALRLWIEPGVLHCDEIRFRVQHLRSGEVRYFREWSALVAYLASVIQHDEDDPPHRHQSSSSSKLPLQGEILKERDTYMSDTQQSQGLKNIGETVAQLQQSTTPLNANDRPDFVRAMKAALFGPGVEGISIQKHGFNVKQVDIIDTGDALVIDGWSGRHISHRRGGTDDDQVKYKITIDKSGKGEPLVEQDVDKSIFADVLTLGIKLLVEILKETLKEWAESQGEGSEISTTASMLSVELGIPPIQSTEDLLTSPEIQQWVLNKAQPSLNGSWEGAASFLITSIAYYAILSYSVSKTTSELQVSNRLAGWLWIIENEKLRRVDSTTGNWTNLAGDWIGHTSMTALGDWLYIIENEALHRVDPATGNRETLAGSWIASTSMATLGDRLYIIENEKLRQVDPATGNWTNLAGDWIGHTSMTALRDRLYIIENEKLRQVDPATGNWTNLAGDWIGHTSMTALGDRLYIIENEKLRQVDPATGNWETLAGDWIGHTSMTALGDRLYITLVSPK